ncbi:magnesium/cobalt transporter CorA [Ancylomarina sp. 16SWW S1-10-2]|uniref:magnesium/cobalt transporter CorA n=1 Tax=Ancylomarina sp. 16SWW S1-10-2 TaxID=2499681 RepID=UPI0012AE5896|nr:magnesium/cobalt transporter CorA [Ancylomarina sp. 16SWW S1-10-2]MRT91729.1 magnesium/cobalt transporter CorA [Ancylomarina sp. 16SWW S1-10-2]
MAKKILNRKRLNPSMPIFTGVRYAEKLGVQLFKYNENACFENINFSQKNFDGFLLDDSQYWLNIHGLHDTEKIKNICAKIGVDDLAIQDILDINQRPKFQNYENNWFFTLKSIIPSEDSQLEQEQFSFILGHNFLISFQEKKADYFEHIRERLRNNVGITRKSGSDYLLFLLLEAILDNYFKTVYDIEVKIEKLGFFDMDTDPSPISLKTIEFYKRQIYQIKKTIVPIKDFVTKIEREQFGFIQEKDIKYFYELRDLCLSLIDDCEQIDLRLESSSNLFFSVQGHRMNQVMKTLTIVATIFIPLTFIAGIYGMNFSNMPELNWEWGYLGVWLVILLVFMMMLVYFRKKKWF